MGDNETGKSTVYDAILYCLIGKNSLGETQFVAVPIGAENEISPKVELECLIDEKPVTLTRIYQSKFMKDKSFKGRATECFINGIAKGVRDFDEYISANIAKSDIFRLLTNPLYFVEQMPAPKGMVVSQAQRGMLYDIAKGIIQTDKEFAESCNNFTELVPYLERYDNVTDYRSSLKTDLARTSKVAADYPTKIEQQISNFIDIEFDEGAIKKESAEIDDSITLLQQQIDSKAAEYNTEVKELNATIQNNRAEDRKLFEENETHKREQTKKHTQEMFAKTKEYRDEISKIENEYNVKKGNAVLLQSSIDSLKNRIHREEKDLIAKRAELTTLMNEKPNIKERCPTCEQKLPADKIKSAIEKYEQQKKTAISRLVEQGKAIKSTYDGLVADLQTKQAELKAVAELQYPAELNGLKTLLKEVEDSDNFEPTNMVGYIENSRQLRQESEQAELKIKALTERLEAETSDIKANIQGLRVRQASLTEKMKAISHNDLIQDGVDKLRAEQKEINIKLDSLQRLMDLTKTFLEEKSKSTKDAINSMFELVKWKLFDYTQDGDLREVCIPTVNGVEYSGLSYSTKLLVGIDIIKTFQKVYGCYLPICVDNSESINFDQTMQNQMIFLNRVEENCPQCKGQAGRRDEKGLWTCKNCEHTWRKTLNISKEN